MKWILTHHWIGNEVWALFPIMRMNLADVSWGCTYFMVSRPSFRALPHHWISPNFYGRDQRRQESECGGGETEGAYLGKWWGFWEVGNVSFLDVGAGYLLFSLYYCIKQYTWVVCTFMIMCNFSQYKKWKEGKKKIEANMNGSAKEFSIQYKRYYIKLSCL